jgi:hypothetical protein
VDPQTLRVWLLLWDQVVSAWSPAYGPRLGDDFKYLVQKGLVIKERVPWRAAPSDIVAREGRHWLYEKLENEAPGAWAIGAGNEEDSSSLGSSGRGLRVQLIRALPVPHQDVALDDILDFRIKCRDEHAALMFHIDEVYLDVVSQPDRPLAELNSIGRLAADSRNILRRVEEAGFAYRLANLAADFNLINASIATSASIGLGLGWPQIVGNSILAGASLTVGRALGLLKSKQSNTPYQYIVSYTHELFRPE